MSVLIRNNCFILRGQLTFISFPMAFPSTFQVYDLQILCIQVPKVFMLIIYYFFTVPNKIYIAPVRNQSRKFVCRPNLSQGAFRHNPRLRYMKPFCKWQAIFYIYGCQQYLIYFSLVFGVVRACSVTGVHKPRRAPSLLHRHNDTPQ